MLPKKYYITLNIVLFLIISLGSMIGANGQQKQKISEIIADASTAIGPSISDYYFKMKYAARSVDKKNREKISSRLYEVFIPAAQPRKRVSFPLVTLEKDGRALSATEVQKERESAGRKLQQIENKALKENNPTQKTDKLNNGYFVLTTQTNAFLSSESVVVNILSFLANCEFSDLREEVLKDRNTFTLRFRPKPNLILNSEENYLGKIAGRIWIDAADRRVVRLEAFPVNAVPENGDDAERESKAVVFYQQIRLPEGVWLVERARLNGLAYPTLFNKLKQTIEAHFNDYRRFSTEVKEVTTDVIENRLR